MKKFSFFLSFFLSFLIACSNNGNDINIPGPYLVSIAVKQNYTENYNLGDMIKKEHITVTAYYSDTSSKIVTDWYVENLDFSKTSGTKTVYISYSEGGITKRETLQITVVGYKATYKFTNTTKSLSGYNGTAGSSGTYVQFGDWPQTKKDTSVKIDESTTLTRGAFTYCVGSDGNYYYHYKKNSTDFGWFKVEPIKWRKIEPFGEFPLYIAENILIADIVYYDSQKTRSVAYETIYPNNYYYSKIRAYLNGLEYNRDGVGDTTYKQKGFLQTAFDSDAQSKIKEREVLNIPKSTWDYEYTDDTSNKYACADTNDKIFLLSVQEVTNSTNAYGYGKDNKTKRVRNHTDFSKASAGSTEYNANTGFYLRSPYYSMQNEVRYVGYDGTVYTLKVDTIRFGIVPVFRF